MEVFPAAGAGPSCGGGGEQRQLLEFLLCSLSLCETRGYIKLNMSLPQLKEKVAHTHTHLSTQYCYIQSVCQHSWRRVGVSCPLQ